MTLRVWKTVGDTLVIVQDAPPRNGVRQWTEVATFTENTPIHRRALAAALVEIAYQLDEDVSVECNSTSTSVREHIFRVARERGYEIDLLKEDS